MADDTSEEEQWVELPIAVARPDAPEVVAAHGDYSAAALRAVRDEEAYVDPESGHACLWPWYREQDDELRADAVARAEELALEMPPFLDEPFESAFYLRYTGPEMLRQLAARAALDPGDLELDRLPVPPDDVVTYEGGGTADSRPAQLLYEVQSAIEQRRRADPPHHPLYDALLTGRVEAYLNALEGREPVYRPVIDLAGDPPVTEVIEPIVGSCWSVEAGVAVYANGSVVVARDGELTRCWPAPVEPVFVGHCTALFDLGEWHALDLDSGVWLEGELDLVATFGGPLYVPWWSAGYEPGLHQVDPYATLDPSGRYAWYGDGAVIRLRDGIAVTDHDPFGLHESPSGIDREVQIAERLSLPGERRTVLDGIAFTHRPARGFRVDAESNLALVLHAGDGWRAFVDGELRRLGERVASVDVAVHAAAFGAGGERLFLVTDNHLVELAWDSVPEFVRATPLTEVTNYTRRTR